MSEPAILVKRREKGSQIWSMDKFENKIFDMREMYEERKEKGLPMMVQDHDVARAPSFTSTTPTTPTATTDYYSYNTTALPDHAPYSADADAIGLVCSHVHVFLGL